MSDFDPAEHDVALAVQRLGRLPDAPLAMPKQRLEAEPRTGLLSRFTGRGPAPADLRAGGQ